MSPRESTRLASGVDDVAVVLDTLEIYALRERALDGGIIRLDKLVLNKLDDERGFACVRKSVKVRKVGMQAKHDVVDRSSTNRPSASRGPQSFFF